MRPLAGQTIVVTGSTRGVGRAIALAMGEAGADVIVHGRNRKRAEEVAGDLKKTGVDCHLLLADLAEPADRDHLLAAAWQWKGRIDGWVNNAGTDVLTGSQADLSFDQKLARLWEVDVAATVHLSRAAGRRMRAGSPGTGFILNMGWDQAEFGMEGDSGEMFAATKGAIMAFTRSLAHSLAPHIRVNCLAPGWIQTAWGQKASPYWHARAVRESLLERWGTPQDVAASAVFLASPAASFINGQVFPINGGFRHGGGDQTPSSPPSRDGSVNDSQGLTGDGPANDRSGSA